ncbi:MAG: hypothetical protein JW810_09880 [Sedimentisphaerales bacterium]|nr:hypothetical protein [Sedimentisphaerales bacterium]
MGGFSLVELLAVSALIVLLAGVLGGMYYRSFHKRQVDQAAAELLLAAKYARVVAVERQQTCTLVLDPANRRVYLAIEEADENVEDAEPQEIVITNVFHKPVPLPEQLRFFVIEIQPLYSRSQESGRQQPAAATRQDERTGLFDLERDNAAESIPPGDTADAAAAADTNTRRIEFRPDGTADAALIQMGTEARRYTLVIQPMTGRAQMQRGQIERIASGVVDLDLNR